MARFVRVAAFALCLLLIMPCWALAMTPGLDDIRDDAMVPATDVTDMGDDALDATAPPASDVLIFSDIGASGTSGQAQDITKNSKFKLSEGKAAPMLDSKLNTQWKNKKKAKIDITLPAGDIAGALFIEWYKKPGDYSIIEYDAGGKEIKTSGKSDSYAGVVNVYPLLEDTRKLTVSFPKKGISISSLRVYSKGMLSSGVQDWQAPLVKTDLMVIAAHQDDEFLYMGGTIPYYAGVVGKNVQVVYMANCGRARYKEALNGLWAAGLNTYPDFVGLQDKYTKKLAEAAKAWNRTRVLDILVERIRKYKPEVIVTHDVKGEYGHGAHMLIATVIQDAIVQAADETKFKKSFEQYGAWQAKKLYLHLYNENQITMDWKKAYPELSGKTPSDIARVGYAAHKSQQKAFKYEDGGRYDNSKFGLAFTAVGQDISKDDMFENIPEGTSELPLAPVLNSAAEGDTDDAMVETDLTGDEADFAEDDLGDEDFGYEDEDDQSFDDTLDSTANRPDPENIVIPTESAPKNNNTLLLSLLVGVPVLLSGSAYGYIAGKKYLRKRRRAKRQEQRKSDSAA